MTETNPVRPHLALLPTLGLLLAGCAGEGDGGPADRDRDGLPDATETTPRSITILLLDGPVTRLVTSDPEAEDTDGDGLRDVDEYGQGADPRDPDTDADGLLDGHAQAPGDGRAATWRARGILESPAGRFLGEMDGCSYGSLRPAEASSDRPFPDRLGDGEERSGWSVVLRGQARHVVSDPCSPDADRDNLPDHEERDAGSDPTHPDSDGDGVQDGADSDPARDLALLVRDLQATAANGTPVTVRVMVGASLAEVRPGNGSSELEVDDQTSTRGSLPVGVVVSAHGPAGEPLALTPDGRGAILQLDLLRGTVGVDGGAPAATSRVELSGRDGNLSFTWGVARR